METNTENTPLTSLKNFSNFQKLRDLDPPLVLWQEQPNETRFLTHRALLIFLKKYYEDKPYVIRIADSSDTFVYSYFCENCNRICFTQNYMVACRGLCYPCQEKVIRCFACGCLVSREESEEHSGATYCTGCSYERSYCDNCGSYVRDDELYGGLCPDCQEDEDDSDEEYCESCLDFRKFYPPRSTTKNDKDTLYLGLEYECEFPHGNRYAFSKELHNFSEGYFSCKGDGSLSCGLEMCSAPATLDEHKSTVPWGQLIDLVRQYGGDSEEDTCGIHVHLDYKFFAPDSTRTVDRYNMPRSLSRNIQKMWIFHSKFLDQAHEIAGRSPQNYCYWTPIAFEKVTAEEINNFIYDNNEHYFALNTGHTSTLEFRIFHGANTLSRLYEILEYCDCVARYTRDTPFRKLVKSTWEDFVAQINPEKYPNLLGKVESINKNSTKATKAVLWRAARRSLTTPSAPRLELDALKDCRYYNKTEAASSSNTYVYTGKTLYICPICSAVHPISKNIRLWAKVADLKIEKANTEVVPEWETCKEQFQKDYSTKYPRVSQFQFWLENHRLLESTPAYNPNHLKITQQEDNGCVTTTFTYCPETSSGYITIPTPFY